VFIQENEIYLIEILKFYYNDIVTNEEENVEYDLFNWYWFLFYS